MKSQGLLKLNKQKRTILRKKSNHDNDNDDRVYIKANVQSVAQRN